MNTTPNRHDLTRRVLAAEPVLTYRAAADVVDVLLDALHGRSSPREHPMPGNVLVHVQGMGGDSAANPDEQVSGELRTPTEDLAHAMILTSTVADSAVAYAAGLVDRDDVELHRPVLDVDLPVRVLPSATPGHHHLLIDRPMPWPRYVELLDALVAAGLVEPGYVEAAKRRGHTGVRVPWLRKGDRAPAPPPGAEVRVEPAPRELTPAQVRAELAAHDCDPWPVTA